MLLMSSLYYNRVISLMSCTQCFTKALILVKSFISTFIEYWCMLCSSPVSLSVNLDIMRMKKVKLVNNAFAAIKGESNVFACKKDR